MGALEEVRKAAVLVGLTVRYLLTTRRGIATAILAATPLLLALSLALARVEAFDVWLFQSVMVPLFLQVVLIFVTLVHAGSLIREEIEDNTLPFLLTRPVARSRIVLYKYAGYAIAVLVLLLPPLVLAYGVTEAYADDPFVADLDVLGAFLAATVLGGLAYGGFFTLLSVATRRPLPAGLLFGFVWESIVGSIPGDVPKLSLIHYLRSILKDLVSVGPLSAYPSDISAGTAAVVLVGFTIAALVLAVVLFRQAEFKHKA